MLDAMGKRSKNQNRWLRGCYSHVPQGDQMMVQRQISSLIQGLEMIGAGIQQTFLEVTSQIIEREKERKREGEGEGE